MQDAASDAKAQTNGADASLTSPPPPNEFKVPPPKRSEASASNDNPPLSQGTVSCSAGVDNKSSGRTGERGVSNMPAWMAQDAASAAGAGQGEIDTTALPAVCVPPPPPLIEFKIPVPKTAAEAVAAFPLLSHAASAGAKRDRLDSSDSAGCGGGSKRLRESSAAAILQEVAMLVQDAEVDASGEQQRLESYISNVVQSGDGLRSVRCVRRIDSMSIIVSRAPQLVFLHAGNT